MENRGRADAGELSGGHQDTGTQLQHHRIDRDIFTTYCGGELSCQEHLAEDVASQTEASRQCILDSEMAALGRVAFCSQLLLYSAQHDGTGGEG